jgi:hypothetical protein
MIGAGKKNSDNTFSGFLIGNLNSAMNSYKTGIYGYNNGI